MVLVVVIAAEPLVVGVRRIAEVLVDKREPAVRSQHAGDLGRTALEVDPVVHRVHRPDRVDAPVVGRDPLRRTVGDLDVGAASAERAARPQHPTEERRRLHCGHTSPGRRGADRTGTHPRTDVDRTFPRLRVDQVDDGVVDLRSPHLGEPAEVAQRAADPSIVGVPVGPVTSMLVVVFGTVAPSLFGHRFSVSASTPGDAVGVDRAACGELGGRFLRPMPRWQDVLVEGVDAKDILHRYLQMARDSLLWKLDGLSEYDVRRPLTGTGTNLLGLVKHLAVVELGYFGPTFARPHGERFPWDERDEEPNEDMFATADEARDDIIALYQRANAHADATIGALSLDDTGTVPWWPDDVNPVTLHWILVHMIAETNRHLGHADIVREQIDGEVGHRSGVDNLPDVDADWWAAYVERVEVTARSASAHPPNAAG